MTEENKTKQNKNKKEHISKAENTGMLVGVCGGYWVEECQSAMLC